jgi:hypothetical protein
LQKSTGTKQQAEAKRRAPAIMAEFAETLAKAEGLLAERPPRATLNDQEIAQLADWHYAILLSTDEAFTAEDAAEDEALVRGIAEQLTEAGIEYTMLIPLDPNGPPTFGLSNRQLIKRAVELLEWAPMMRAALARGDISMVSEAMAELLDRAQINLDPNCAAYRKLGLAVLRADVRAQEAVGETLLWRACRDASDSEPRAHPRGANGPRAQGAPDPEGRLRGLEEGGHSRQHHRGRLRARS